MTYTFDFSLKIVTYWKSNDPETPRFFEMQQVSKEVLFPTSKSKSYCLYKIVNLINGKIYIGQHFGKNCDSYMGSGKIIKKAIQKYGANNFKRIDKFYTNNKLFVDQMEKDFIAFEKEVNASKCYNIAEGGEGGSSLKFATPEEITNKSNRMREVSNNRSAEEKRVIRKRISESNKGKVMSDEARKKISEAQKGAKWYKNVKEGRSIFLHANKTVPEGYVLGRLPRYIPDNKE